MNKCAFIIPLHPKHFNYGYYIINELKMSDADLYFIFTNNDEKNVFLKNLNEDIHLKFLLLSDFTNIEIVEKNRSYVPIKKLYALSVLYKKYEFISCIDSEIKFLKKNGFYNMMKNIVYEKIICGGKLEDGVPESSIIYESLIRLTDPIYHNNLLNISQEYKIYTWWSNLPVYDCKYAEDFLKWINFNNNLDKFSFYIFDDMTYNYYCILVHNYILKEIPNCKHSLEFSDSSLIEYVDQNLNKLYWVNNYAYNQNKNYYENNNFFIIFHLDRWALPNDFNVIQYKNLNIDLKNMSDSEAINHYLNYGIKENRIYKLDSLHLPNDFNAIQYKNLNIDLKNMSDSEAINHYLNYGIKENRIYKLDSLHLPNDFNVIQYKNLNFDLKHMSDSEAINHYLNYGIKENRIYQ